jgi:hypothetical protein
VTTYAITITPGATPVGNLYASFAQFAAAHAASAQAGDVFNILLSGAGSVDPGGDMSAVMTALVTLNITVAPANRHSFRCGVDGAFPANVCHVGFLECGPGVTINAEWLAMNGSGAGIFFHGSGSAKNCFALDWALTQGIECDPSEAGPGTYTLNVSNCVTSGFAAVATNGQTLNATYDHNVAFGEYEGIYIFDASNNATGHVNAVVRNNIANTFVAGGNGTLTASHNTSFDGTATTQLADANAINLNKSVADSLAQEFTACTETAVDMTLKPGATSIDSGLVVAGQEIDGQGWYRPQGQGVDRGALEYQTTRRRRR